MLPLLAPILTQLAGAGMQKVVDAVLDKGTAVVEEKLGITLTPGPDGKLSDEKLASLKEAAMKHEEFMFEQEVKDRGDKLNKNQRSNYGTQAQPKDRRI